MSWVEWHERYYTNETIHNFESSLFQIYRKHIGKKAAFTRKLDFFARFAEDYFKANARFTPIETITVDDFPCYDFNEKSYAWTKKVMPVIYNSRFGNENEALELLGGNSSNQTKSTFLRVSETILDEFLGDMAKGKRVNMPFMLSFQRLVFELVGQANKFVENDFISNRRRLNAMMVTFRTDADEAQEEFDGVRYRIQTQGPLIFAIILILFGMISWLLFQVNKRVSECARNKRLLEQRSQREEQRRQEELRKQETLQRQQEERKARAREISALVEERRQEEQKKRKQEELFEAEQEEKGFSKFVDRFGQEHWDLLEKIEKLRKKDFEEKQKENGLVKYKGEWVSNSEMETRIFKAQTSDSLACDVAAYVRKHSSAILLNSKMLNEYVRKFWLENYRAVFNNKLWDRTIASKMNAADAAVLDKYLELLTNEVDQWAQNRNLSRLTRTDVKLFLVSSKLRLSTSFEQMLYREAKLKYRWLPSWKRE